MSGELERALWVERSSYRRDVLVAVLDGARRPSDVVEETGLRPPHVSRALNELEGRGLVELAAASGKARVYRVTEAGEELWDVLDEEGLV